MYVESILNNIRQHLEHLRTSSLLLINNKVYSALLFAFIDALRYDNLTCVGTAQRSLTGRPLGEPIPIGRAMQDPALDNSSPLEPSSALICLSHFVGRSGYVLYSNENGPSRPSKNITLLVLTAFFGARGRATKATCWPTQSPRQK